MTQNIRTIIGEVVSDPRRAKALADHVWRHFKEDRCLDEAASLCFTSLLALVPLMAVVFGIASAFPTVKAWSEQLKHFIYLNLMPDSGSQVETYLEQFIASVGDLTLPGLLFLVVTALLLMMRIERSFNRIWRVPVARGLINKVTMYWAVLTLGPMALGAATALSVQPLLDLVGGELVVDAVALRAIGVFLLTWAAFCIMFLLVPNCRVPVVCAAAGSFLSTVLFTAAKAGFVAYVSRANYSVIYGALASVPIFLLWLYIVWIVILLGASLAASLTTFRERGAEWTWPRAWEFLLVYRLLGHFYCAQGVGRALGTTELLEAEPGLASARLKDILESLMRERLLTPNSDEDWVLVRDLSRYTVLDLYGAGEYHLPIGKDLPVPSTSPWDEAFMTMLNDVALDMDRPLAAMYDTGSAVPPTVDPEPGRRSGDGSGKDPVPEVL